VSHEQKRELVEPGCRRLSIGRQCELFGLPRSSYYYETRPPSERDLRQMRMIDEEYTSVWDCRDALRHYFEFYNHQRRHQGLGRRTPWAVYQTGV
jgi:transposase InsO family protein